MDRSLRGYQLSGEWHQANEGRWIRAVRDSKSYFLKQYTNLAVEPDRTKIGSVITEQSYITALKTFNDFKARRDKINEALKSVVTSGGNIVVPLYSFVHDHYYTEVSQYYENLLSEEEIFDLPSADKYRILITLIATVKAIHSNGIIHSDIKFPNLLCIKNVLGKFILKLTDFGAAFFTNDKPANPHEYSGDPCYASPELGRLWLANDEQDDIPSLIANISTKSDIFSLGVVSHIVLTGAPPILKHAEDAATTFYPFEVLLNGGELKVSEDITEPKYREAINLMLSADPNKRPDAAQLLDMLRSNPNPTAHRAERPLRLSAEKNTGDDVQLPSARRYILDAPWSAHSVIWTQELKELLASGEYSELKRDHTLFGEEIYTLKSELASPLHLTLQAMISRGYAVQSAVAIEGFGDTDVILRAEDREQYSLNTEYIRRQRVLIAPVERANTLLGRSIAGYEVYNLNTNTKTFYTVTNLLLTKYLVKRTEIKPAVTENTAPMAPPKPSIADRIRNIAETSDVCGDTEDVLRDADKAFYEVNTALLRASSSVLKPMEKRSPLLGTTVFGYELSKRASGESKFMTTENLVLTGYLRRK
ncbi:MAG: protein kinase [Clostridia bacterium]|nr:protein kinase [Clostridia bacterium]